MKYIRCDICGYEASELHYHLFANLGHGHACRICYDKIKDYIDNNKEDFLKENGEEDEE